MWSLFSLLTQLVNALKATVFELTSNTRATNSNTAALQESNQLLGRLLERLRLLPQPGPLSISVTKENGSMLTFTVQLPAEPIGFNDIASGELTVTIAGGAPAVMPTTKGQTEVAGLTGNDNDSVSLSFVYIDDAANRSYPSTFSDTLKDSIAPPQPGALGITVTGES